MKSLQRILAIVRKEVRQLRRDNAGIHYFGGGYHGACFRLRALPGMVCHADSARRGATLRVISGHPELSRSSRWSLPA